MLIDKFNRPLNLLEYESADGCTYACGFCPYREKPLSLRALANEDFVTFVSVLSMLGLERVRLGGGEPLLRPDIAVLVKDLSDTKIKSIELATNALLLDEKMTANLYAGGISKIYVTMPSADPKRYQEITRTDNFKKVIGNIEGAIKAGIKIIFKVPLFGEVSGDDIRNLHLLSKKMGANIKFIQTGLVQGVGDLVQFIKSNTDTQGGELMVVSTFANRACESCRRVWVSHDGKLRLCEGADDGAVDLIDFFDNSPSADEIVDLCTKISLNKPMAEITGCTKPDSVWNVRG